jgi:hypothetical protein
VNEEDPEDDDDEVRCTSLSSNHAPSNEKHSEESDDVDADNCFPKHLFAAPPCIQRVQGIEFRH